jgi:hypothetical protein
LRPNTEGNGHTDCNPSPNPNPNPNHGFCTHAEGNPDTSDAASPYRLSWRLTGTGGGYVALLSLAATPPPATLTMHSANAVGVTGPPPPSNPDHAFCQR